MSELPQYRNLIGGELKPAAAGAWLDSTNPSTGEVWAQIPKSSPDDAVAAVEAASAAFRGWADTPPEARGDYLKKVAQLFRDHGDELARLESTDNGNPIYVSQFSCGSGMASLWDRLANQTVEASTGRTVQLDSKTLGLTLREPYGVVAAIVPFNMPVAMLSNKVATALAGGNTVVVKPPEQASVACLRLGELLNEVLPAGVVNIVAGEGDVGDAMVRHPAVTKITMTGSSATAKLIQKAAADTLTPSVFELGGKSPNIVLDDADLDAAALGITVMSIYTFNAGQACVGGSRILVQSSILDEVIERIKGVISTTQLGDPFTPTTTMGPLISKEQYDKVVAHIEDAKKETELLFGGSYGPGLVPDSAGGYWVQPTLFLAKDNSPRVCREEVFGPVAVVIPFDTDDEAIALANDSRYGLASGVWSRDLARIHRYIRDIESGNVWVNTYMQTRFELPFTGVKDSGYGHDDILDFTREKAAVIAIPRSPGDGPGTGTVFGGAH